jgi:hypothetical protein
MPTLLHLLGYPIPASVDGRVLFEGLAQSAAPSALAPEKLAYSTEFATAMGAYRQHLEATRVGTTVYLDHGWVEG